MKRISINCLLTIAIISASITAYAQDPNFHIYLCFGQSNMEGQGTIEAQDRTTNNRVKVLADLNCSNLNRTYGVWYTAAPPLNRCYSGLGIADYFGKNMANGTASAITIGLVPAAVSGCDIALYQKSAPIGRAGADIPPQFNGGYAWLLDLGRKAQQAGVIKGIIFHQGETNTNDPNWKYKVQEIVNNLRTDLGIGNVPFLAGELLYAQYGSCCSSHNVEVNKLPGLIPNCSVISASGLPGADNAHFTSASYRDYGNRYAQKMLTLVNTAPVTSGSVSNGTYRLIFRHSGLSLNVENNSTADGGNVIQWPYAGGRNEQWFVRSVGNSQYSIINANSGRGLDVYNNSTADGADINQWYYAGNNNQKWRIESVGSGYYRIVNVNSGKCIDVYGNNTSQGAPINQWGCNGGNNQSFTFSKLSSSLSRAAAANPVTEDAAASKITLYPNPSSGAFNVNTSGTYTYTIYNAAGAAVEKGTGRGKAAVGIKLQSGAYVLKVESQKASKNFKLIKN